MPRSIWKGSIAFGLVNIPVSLTSAEVRPDIQLHMVDSRDHARIRYERVNADTGEEVPWDQMVRAYEHSDGEFVLLKDEELASLRPELTKSIEISRFVQLEEIDTILFDKPYFLEPEKRGRKAYALLREALRKSGRAGISRVVIRTREYLSAMFVRDDVLMLMLLRFPQEIRATTALELPDSKDEKLAPPKRELELAAKLIDEMSEKWDPEEFHDEYRKSLMNYIEEKIAKGSAVDDVKSGTKPDRKATKDGNVVDLAAYLEQSLAKSTKPAKKPTKSAPKKNAAAKKSTSARKSPEKKPTKKSSSGKRSA